MVGRQKKRKKRKKPHLIEYNSDGKTAAWTNSNFLAVAHVAETNLKLVSARAGVCIQ